MTISRAACRVYGDKGEPFECLGELVLDDLIEDLCADARYGNDILLRVPQDIVYAGRRQGFRHQRGVDVISDLGPALLEEPRELRAFLQPLHALEIQ